METSKESIGRKSSQSILCAADSPAQALALQADGKGTMMKDGSGPNSYVVFAKFDQNGSLQKMSSGCCQSMLDGNLQKFSETFPKRGMMRNGLLSKPLTLELPTEGNGSSSWPTPTNSMMTQQDMEQARYAGNSKKRPKYRNAKWPSPKAGNTTGAGIHGDGGRDLQTVVSQWNTPSTEDAKGRPYTYDRGDKNHPRLSLEGQAWATPTSRDWKSDSSQKSDQEIYGKKGRPLGRQVLKIGKDGPKSLKDGPNSLRQWMTPKASDGEFASPRTSDRPMEMSTHLQTQTQTITGHQRLNPLFVEWLMGGRDNIGWTCICGAVNGYGPISQAGTKGISNPEGVRGVRWEDSIAEAPPQSREGIGDKGSLSEVPHRGRDEIGEMGAQEKPDEEVHHLRKVIPPFPSEDKNLLYNVLQGTGQKECNEKMDEPLKGKDMPHMQTPIHPKEGQSNNMQSEVRSCNDLEQKKTCTCKRTERLKALGNAVVPQVAEVIGRLIMEANDHPLVPEPEWEKIE